MAILRVVQWHSHCTQALRRALEEGHTPHELEKGHTPRGLEKAFEAYEQRRKDIAALQDALERSAENKDEPEELTF